MIARLALLFTTVTLLELSILIPLGRAVGLPATIAIVIGTAFVGASLAKRQGATIWSRIQEELSKGKAPGDSLLDGLAVLIAGTMLLTPGVLTDVAGILLLIPACRVPLKAIAKKYAKKMIDKPDVTFVQHSQFEDMRSFGHSSATGPGQSQTGEQSGPTDPTGASTATGASPGSTARRRAAREEDIIDVEPVDEEASGEEERPEPMAELSTSTD